MNQTDTVFIVYSMEIRANKGWHMLKIFSTRKAADDYVADQFDTWCGTFAYEVHAAPVHS